MPTLNWIGKEKVMSHHQDVPFRVFQHKYNFSSLKGRKSKENGLNKIIYGDNLEALKSLLPEYEGKIKCIYIDPPYNTGNEKWVYNDNVNHPKIKKWIGEVVGKDDDDFSRHDKWLCMMYPRLKLLQKLLSEDGGIFISIGKDEFAHLKVLCDTIFGRKNFRECFIWYNEGNTENQEDVTLIHEYVLFYAKDIKRLTFQNIVDPNIPEDSKIRRNFVENSLVKNGYKNPPSEILLPKGFPCEVENITFDKTDNYKELLSEIETVGFIDRPFSKKHKAKYPLKKERLIIEGFKLKNEAIVYTGWSAANKLKKFIDNNCKPYSEDGAMLSFYLSKNGVVYYRKEGRQSHFVPSVLRNMGTTEKNKYMLEDMGIKFDFPKPVELISFLISSITGKDDYVLDSFAGSGTTSHAVLNLNKEDDGKRKFILIELEEYADKLTAKRTKAVINGYSSKKGNVEGVDSDFDFYELGQPIFKDNENLNEVVGEDKIRNYIYYTETKQPLTRPQSKDAKYLLDNYQDTGYYFYYEKDSLTTLDNNSLGIISELQEQYIIYADICLLDEQYMLNKNIIFKKIPRDIKRF